MYKAPLLLEKKESVLTRLKLVEDLNCQLLYWRYTWQQLLFLLKNNSFTDWLINFVNSTHSINTTSDLVVCMHVHVCACVWMCVCMCARMYGQSFTSVSLACDALVNRNTPYLGERGQWGETFKQALDKVWCKHIKCVGHSFSNTSWIQAR